MPTWVRVRDDTTGSVYDVDERSLRDGMTVLPGHAKLTGPYARPRPTKHRPEALRALPQPQARPGRADTAAGADSEPAHSDPAEPDDAPKERDQ